MCLVAKIEKYHVKPINLTNIFHILKIAVEQKLMAFGHREMNLIHGYETRYKLFGHCVNCLILKFSGLIKIDRGKKRCETPKECVDTKNRQQIKPFSSFYNHP